jgi:hypothetical protein
MAVSTSDKWKNQSTCMKLGACGVGDLKLRAIILHKKVQEDPSTPLQKHQEEVEDLGREVGTTRKIIIKLKTQK